MLQKDVEGERWADGGEKEWHVEEDEWEVCGFVSSLYLFIFLFLIYFLSLSFDDF